MIQPSSARDRKLLNYLLAHFPITRIEAIIKFGIQNLTSAISRLRKCGYKFKKEYITNTRTGDKECHWRLVLPANTLVKLNSGIMEVVDAAVVKRYGKEHIVYFLNNNGDICTITDQFITVID